MTVGEKPSPPGGWVVDEVSYVDPVRTFCDLCGRPLTRRWWRMERDGQVGRYCEPAHAEMDAPTRHITGERAEAASA